jgi:hypothetical protein
VSRNARNDLRKKRRRHRRDATWQMTHQNDDLLAFIRNLPEFFERWQRALADTILSAAREVERIGSTYPETRLLLRRYRNPWQWQCWWRL